MKPRIMFAFVGEIYSDTVLFFITGRIAPRILMYFLGSHYRARGNGSVFSAMSLMEDARLTLGNPASLVREGTSRVPYTEEVRAALAGVHMQLRRSSTILISSLNRLVLSTEIYRVPRLDIFQERGGLTSQFGAFGQTMRFIAYVVYSDQHDTYMLRMDDILSGIVAYRKIQTKDRLLPADKIIRIENQIIAGIAGIMYAYDSDWVTIWGGYIERVKDYSEEDGNSVNTMTMEFLELINTCPDSKKLVRVDLHLSHYTYDRLRFTIMNGEVDSFAFKRNNAIYIPGNRIKDYGSMGAESLLETFIDVNEISAFVENRKADSHITQHESTLVDELVKMTQSLDDIDVTSREWREREETLLNQPVPRETDDEFFDLEDSLSPSSLAAELVDENTYWSLQTDSDEEGDGDVWDGISDT